jgi:anti-anti-sigma factor
VEAPISEWELKHEGAVAELVLRGEFDLFQVSELKRALERVAELPGLRTLVVDFTAVEFADSSAVAWLLGCDRTISEAGGEVVVRVGPGAVAEVLELTGVEERMRVERV